MSPRLSKESGALRFDSEGIGIRASTKVAQDLDGLLMHYDCCRGRRRRSKEQILILS